MIENVTEEFLLNDRPFAFELCRKQEQFGSVPIDYWWIDNRQLYGQRNNKSPNRAIITDFFWAACQHGDSTDDPGAQETFILANLLPLVRSTGSKRVFADSHLFSQSEKIRAAKTEVAQELEGLLNSSDLEPITMVEFYNKTGEILGPPEFDDGVHTLYQEMTKELLRDACQHLQQDTEQGLEIARQKWLDFERSIGRRSGQREKKNILDVVSFESRVALHRCYSATWCALLPCLAQKYDFSEANFLLHRAWHLDNVSESAGDLEVRFHLFHGHTFGLHPASGTFLKTRIAKRLVGDWLVDPINDEKFGKVLAGILIAVHQYVSQREAQALLRREQPRNGGDLDEIQGRLVEESSGQRRPKRRKTDACK